MSTIASLNTLSVAALKALTAPMLKALTSPILQAVINNLRALRRWPRSLKWLFYLLVILNIRSFPLVWHMKVFSPVLRIQWKYILFRLSIAFKSRPEKARAIEAWWESVTPIGRNPFDPVRPFTRRWASIDDIDFNMHLSNSCYAKSLDAPRFEAAVQLFPQFLRAGGAIPLAATHFHFIKEIPMFTPYEIRQTIAAWDEKWIYIVCRFVSFKNKSRKQTTEQKKNARLSKRISRRLSITAKDINKALNPEDANNLFRGTMCGPSDDISGTSTPLTSSMRSFHLRNTEETLTARLFPNEEPDGATLHTVCISQFCFKLGRVTIPPALVLATNGFATPTISGVMGEDGFTTKPGKESGFSRSNPPPHWENVKSLIARSCGGNVKKYGAFLKGGWREYAEADRWWDDALGGQVEEKRKEQLEALTGLRIGMNSARRLY